MNLAKYAGRLGDLPPTVGMPWEYFEQRGCFLDCRGPLEIDAESVWGLRVRVFTETHAIGDGAVGQVTAYPVTVRRKAWIGSDVVLTGCWIGEGAIVAAGSVVRGQTVEPRVMVAGNPARVIAHWNGTVWVYVDARYCGYNRLLA